MTDSQQLLVEYAKNGSESAFRELVSRYSNLVYSTALRLVSGDTHSAEDVAQTVFMGLASKGRALSTEVMLGGWLHQHTYHVAMMALRADRRRQSREREAVEMNILQDDSGAGWREVAPILDEAITQLGSEDRTAILLRFFEQRDFRSVGEALGSDEDAARMRVNRALEKLHSLLKHRGATLSVAALGTALATQAVTAAPAGFAGSVAATALASAATGTATSLGVLKSLTLAKLTLGAAGVGVAVVLVVLLFHERQPKPAGPSRDLGQYVEITSGIDVTWSRPDPANADRMVDNTQHYTAVCTIGADRWRIDHNCVANGEASLVFDGTNVYELSRITKPWSSSPEFTSPLARQLGLDREPSAEVYSSRFIEIWPGDLPLNDVGANLPWLAFCSGHYLKKKGRVLPLLFSNIRYSADAFACRDKTSCFDDELGLPRSVDWKYSAAAFAKSLDNPRVRRDDYVRKMHSVLGNSVRDGALRSRYAVLEWTNYSGRHIPAKFELIQYGNNGEWSSRPWFKAVGQVESIRYAPKPQGVFLSDSNQWVNDCRFRSSAKLIDLIHYAWPSNAIPPVSDPSLVAEFRRMEARAPADPKAVDQWWRRILPGFGRP